MLGWVATVTTAALGALILGEYALAGWTPYVSGLLFGLAVAEVEMTISRDTRTPAAVGVGLVTGAGLAWAAWISSGRGVAPVPTGAWAGVGVGVAAGFGWIKWSGTRAGNTRPEP